MPAYLTHYACGLMGYRSLPQGELKKIIRRHASVYNMGLAGPDLFFYSLWEISTKSEPVGRIMHKYRTGRFMRTLLEEVLELRGARTDKADFRETRSEKAERDYETALAYFSGFLGHYCLDSRAHALVYRECAHPDSRIALGKHFRYEAAMDAMCCREILGRSIKKSHQLGLLRLSAPDRKVIARILSRALKRTYGEEMGTPSELRLRLILKEYYLISTLITDPAGFREWTLEKAERRIQGYPFASPLFINDNRYGLGQKDWERFYIRFKKGEKALNRAFGKLSMLAEAAEKEVPAQTVRALAEDFLRETGSWSYHGMHLREASSDQPLETLTGHSFRKKQQHGK